jgi:hypothetical protein
LGSDTAEVGHAEVDGREALFQAGHFLELVLGSGAADLRSWLHLSSGNGLLVTAVFHGVVDLVSLPDCRRPGLP